MAKQNEMTLNEFESVFEYLLGQNKKLTEQGLTPIAIGVEGEAGIGKTSLIEQVANRRGMTLCKINLAQLEEVGDLTGYPQKEYLTKWVKKDGSIGQAWCTDEQLKKAPAGVKISDKVRMGYAKPAWLPTQENPNGTICLLDDYTRANPLFMQACMELINTGQYISWSLPKNTTVVLTTNPDNGEFSVSSLDSAQKTRFVNFSLKLDVKEWAAWAESQHIDGRAINFALFYGEELFGKHGGIQTINPRAYTTFCKAISGIEDWESAKGLPLILQISMGCFLNDTDNIVGGLFTTFINRRLDKLIEPQEMLSGKWETVEPKIEACVLRKECRRLSRQSQT